MKNNNGILIFNNGGMDLGLISAMMEAEDCTVYLTSLPLEAIHILQTKNIDVILASSHLEGMEGQEFKALVDKIRPGVSIFLLPAYLPSKLTDNHELPTECTINLKEFVYFIHNHIRNEKILLEDSTRFKDFFFSFTDRLLQIFEVNDKYFFNNDHFVADLSRRIAIKMELDEQLVDAIHLAALLRDIGKIGIQNEILNGKSRLESGEFEIMKCHPLNTVQILRKINFPWNVDLVIRHHHEQYNGNGYPDGLKGRFIPLGSRIIAIADSFVAMTTDRAYRKALTEDAAVNEILKMVGSQFDPEVVEVFMAVLNERKSARIERKSLLIIEPDESVAAYLRLNLNGDYYNLSFAATASEALGIMSVTEPALVIASHNSLQTDNHIFYAKARLKAIPFIVFTEINDASEGFPYHSVELLSKPIDVDELASKIKSALRSDAPTPQQGVSEVPLKGVAGNLEDMSLTDIIQVLNMGMKTAKVVVTNENTTGEIYLKSGKVTSAELGDLTGCDAFYKLVEWNKGEFRVFHGQLTDKNNITVETMTLMLEATKVLDERRYAETSKVPL